MTDENRNRQELLGELVELRRRVAELEESEAKSGLTDSARRRSDETYRLLFEESIDGIMIVVDGRIARVNQALAQLHGRPAEELIGLKPSELVHPDDRKLAEQRIKRLTNGELLSTTMEYKALRADGSVLWVEVRSRPLRWQGRGAFQTIVRDVTERKTAEEDLRKTRDYLANVLENSADGIGIVDGDGKFIMWNKMAAELYGYTFEELQGKSAFSLYADRDELEKMLEELRRKGLVRGFEINMKRKDGRIVPFELSISMLKDSRGSNIGSVCVARSLEKQKSLQAQLLQAQKMEAIGTLAGGVAHDFNNLLQAIQGYAELVLLGKNSGDPDYGALQEIVRASRRGGELTRKLLTFSRKVESQKRPLDINHEVREVQRLLERTIPRMIEIELRLANKLAIVNADPVQVEQVLMNLVVNAKDAMPEGGKLVVQTQNVTLDEEDCKGHVGARPGDYVLLSISDSGQGMDRETLRHIFDPFFTTKEPSRGTGLGLATVYGIIQSHDGFILCSSRPGAGTTFKIYLPVIERTKSNRERPAPTSAGAPLRHP